MRVILIGAVFLMSCIGVVAQEPTAAGSERRVALSEKAVALDASGAAVLEATLKTTALNGSEDSPVTNISLVVRNSSVSPMYSFPAWLLFTTAQGYVVERVYSKPRR